MAEYPSWSGRVFEAFNYTFMIVLALICFFPFVHIFAISLSSNAAASAGIVRLWPVDFNLNSYRFIAERPEFLQSLLVTLKRVALAVPIVMTVTTLIAYPLSKSNSALPARTLYVWIFVFTMLFNGGLIPIYMTLRMYGLLDSIWALALHHGINVFNVVILLNFFRGISKELEEAAFMDGAGHWTVLFRIFIPLSKPALATLTLFTIVFHWNAWFDGIVFMNTPSHYPLQSYLYTIVVGMESMLSSSVGLELLDNISDRTVKSAQIFLAAIPVIMVYPFLQKYFVQGMTLGALKE